MDGIEFFNRCQQPFDWENEELGDTLPEVEEPIYPDILAEIPGVLVASDFEDVSDAVTTPPPRTFAEIADAALRNAALSKRTGVDGQFTGVDRPFTQVDETAFSQILPGSARVEPDDDDDAAPPLLRRPDKVEDNNNDEEDDDKNEERTLIENVEEDDEELMEEYPPIGY